MASSKGDNLQLRQQVRIPSPLLVLDTGEKGRDSSPIGSVRPFVVHTPTPKLKAARESLKFPRRKPRRVAKAPLAFTFKSHVSPSFSKADDDNPPLFPTECLDKSSPSTTPKRRVYSYSRCLRPNPSLHSISESADGHKSALSLQRSFETGRKSPDGDCSPMSLFVGKPIESENFVLDLKPKRHKSTMQLPVMAYYKKLTKKPERGFRTPNTNQKRVASNGGYRTKLQKDPTISRSALGLYAYVDSYEKDEVFMRKMQKVVNLRKRRSSHDTCR